MSLGLALTMVAAESALADRFWITNGNGDFSNTANWDATSSAGPGPASAPDQTQPTFYQVAGASPYTVNFTGVGGGDSVTVNNNNVTLDLNGNDYLLAQSGVAAHDVNITATGGLASLLRVTDGAMKQVNPPTNNNTASFLRVNAAAGAGNSAQLVVDTGGVYWAGQTAIGGANSNPANSRLTIQNGGQFFGTSGTTAGGASSLPGSIVVDGANSLLQVYSLGIGGNETGTLDVSNGGTVRIRVPQNLYAPTGISVASRGTLTLNNGVIELNGSAGGVFDFYTQTSYPTAPQGIRGNGTIRRATGATGLSTVDSATYNPGGYHGILRPGDLSITPAVGTITLEEANYTSLHIFGSTGALHSELYLDLGSPTSYDQLLLTDPGADDGVVTATLAGSIFFNNINPIDFAGATVIDFVRAENIVDGGFTTPNLAATAAQWTYNGSPQLAYSLGIVTVGPNDVRLRLTVVPEPASLALLALGGLVIARRPRRAGVSPRMHEVE